MRKHAIIDGEHINLEEYRKDQERRREIKEMAARARSLSAKARSYAQKAYEARKKTNAEIAAYFGLEDEE